MTEWEGIWAYFVHVACHCHINALVSKCQPIKVTSALKPSLFGRDNSEGIHHPILYVLPSYQYWQINNTTSPWVINLLFFVWRFFNPNCKSFNQTSAMWFPGVCSPIRWFNYGKETSLWVHCYMCFGTLPSMIEQLSCSEGQFQEGTDDLLASICLDLNQVKLFSNLLHLPTQALPCWDERF